jgi:hypothetical protein
MEELRKEEPASRAYCFVNLSPILVRKEALFSGRSHGIVIVLLPLVTSLECHVFQRLNSVFPLFYSLSCMMNCYFLAAGMRETEMR